MEKEVYRLSYPNMKKRDICDGKIHNIQPKKILKFNDDTERFVLVYEDLVYNKKMATLIEKKDGEFFHIVFCDISSFYLYLFNNCENFEIESINNLPHLIIHTKAYANFATYYNKLKEKKKTLIVYKDVDEKNYITLEDAIDKLSVFSNSNYYKISYKQFQYLLENYKLKTVGLYEEDKKYFDYSNIKIKNKNKSKSNIYIVIKNANNNITNSGIVNYENYSKGITILQRVSKDDNELIFKQTMIDCEEFKKIIEFIKENIYVNSNEIMLIDSLNNRIPNFSLVGYDDDSNIQELYIPLKEEDKYLTERDILNDALIGNRICTIISHIDNSLNKRKLCRKA